MKSVNSIASLLDSQASEVNSGLKKMDDGIVQLSAVEQALNVSMEDLRQAWNKEARQAALPAQQIKQQMNDLDNINYMDLVRLLNPVNLALTAYNSYVHNGPSVMDQALLIVQEHEREALRKQHDVLINADNLPVVNKMIDSLFSKDYIDLSELTHVTNKRLAELNNKANKTESEKEEQEKLQSNSGKLQAIHAQRFDYLQASLQSNRGILDEQIKLQAAIPNDAEHVNSKRNSTTTILSAFNMERIAIRTQIGSGVLTDEQNAALGVSMKLIDAQEAKFIVEHSGLKPSIQTISTYLENQTNLTSEQLKTHQLSIQNELASRPLDNSKNPVSLKEYDQCKKALDTIKERIESLPNNREKTAMLHDNLLLQERLGLRAERINAALSSSVNYNTSYKMELVSTLLDEVRQDQKRDPSQRMPPEKSEKFLATIDKNINKLDSDLKRQAAKNGKIDDKLSSIVTKLQETSQELKTNLNNQLSNSRQAPSPPK